MLENACKANNQKSLEGLTENQKVSLIKGDKYYLGETTRWSRIWSTVFADIEQPRSPYLDRGDGLKVSMIRDFWDSDGHEFVSKFIAGLESNVNWNSARHHMILKEVSDGLLIQPTRRTSSFSQLVEPSDLYDFDPALQRELLK
ncbi:hypothetical protein FOMG_17740 [Fusarium oxysporum f. sp. melonis 26406]|uniref:Uncharacterized protein n=1 Tax=Fusarium oxysporum f. sp. melonis 26406 TaxID=1089452 RepID=W9ZX18_FUSOX|nr:hypothetical protein FOMG_17740 [Fusarium oxysporum f. sp. melonis 26406]